MHILFLILKYSLAPRATLIAENLALRQQVEVLKRHAPRLKLRRRDRIFWVLLQRFWKGWRSSLILVNPSTVLGWHRQGWRLFWRLKAGKPGRPPIPRSLILLIRQMSEQNRLWGAPRLQLELRLLSHDISEATIAKYMIHRPRPGGGQRWTTFLRNHACQIAACDLLTVQTLTFRILYVFVVLSHDRREILHFGITANPTDDWLSRQIRIAFSDGARAPRFLLRDRDSSYGTKFSKVLADLGIKTLRSSPQSPWQNAHVERVIGTLRRECLDHVIVLSAAGLRTILSEYVGYYNSGRAHQSLAGMQPVPRPRKSDGRVMERSVLGGLHHVYSRAA